jgi:hypothetical protein
MVLPALCMPHLETGHDGRKMSECIIVRCGGMKACAMRAGGWNKVQAPEGKTE